MRILLLFLAIAALARAGDSPLVFPSLDLLDGRKLKNVAVKSYDASSDQVLLVADGKALLVPLTTIPPPFAGQVKAGAPVSGATTAVVAAPPANAASTTPALVSVPIVNPATPAPEVPAQKKHGAAKAGKLLDRHKAVAEARAKRYFEYEFQGGSNYISVSKLSLDTDPPVPVDGWQGRYRTSGKAYLEFYDSRGGSFQRATNAFEVVTEQKPGEEEPRALDFTLK